MEDSSKGEEYLLKDNQDVQDKNALMNTEEYLGQDSTTENTNVTEKESNEFGLSEQFGDDKTVFIDNSEDDIHYPGTVIVDQVEEHIGDGITASFEEVNCDDFPADDQIALEEQSVCLDHLDPSEQQLGGTNKMMVDGVTDASDVIDNKPQVSDDAREITENIQNGEMDYSREVLGKDIEGARMISSGMGDSSDDKESISVQKSVDELDGKKVDENPVDDSNIFEFEDVVHENAESRIKMFSQGLTLEKQGKQDAALKCYLGCLSNLQMDSNFALLPHCLRNIADIFFQHGEYEKAICFIQAEKLFYENALIDTTQIQKKLEEIHSVVSDGQVGGGDSQITKDTLRADEYEHLAKLCMDQKQPQLALEYAGKATKIRQQIYGEDHKITKDSLDYFATLYAEVGRHQYNESLSHLAEGGDCNTAEQDETETDVPVQSIPRSPSSILRQRKSGDDKEKKQVRFEEPTEHHSSIRHQEEWISQVLLCILFAICFFLLFILGSWLFCNLYSNTFCEQTQDRLDFYVRKIKYFYYQYASTKKVKYS